MRCVAARCGVIGNGVEEEATMARGVSQEYDVTRNHIVPLGASWPERTPAIDACVSGYRTS